jgi:hypothetical protein
MTTSGFSAAIAGNPASATAQTRRTRLNSFLLNCYLLQILTGWFVNFAGEAEILPDLRVYMTGTCHQPSDEPKVYTMAGQVDPAQA